MKFGTAIVMVLGGSALAWAAAPSHVVNSGTSQWVAASQTGRADMLVFGDSVTWFGGHGWDDGLQRSAANRLGLAGSGLIADSGATGQGVDFGTYGGIYFNNGWNTTIGGIPSDRQGYALRAGSPGVSAGATPLRDFSFGVLGALPGNAAYDWNLYTASQPGGGSMAAYRRSVEDGFPTLQTLPAVSTATPAGGLQKVTFSFAAQPQLAASAYNELRLIDTTNTSVLYSRVTRPGATGLTVSTLGYGGHSSVDFLRDIWLTMSPAGRSEYLKRVVDGGSGKLNVMLAEGFNDRNETDLSVNGLASNSPEGFRDNIEGLIATLRQDWVAAGLSLNNLSFTLVGMYQISDSTGTPADLLARFAEQERQIALGDSQISFVDLYNAAPNFAAADGLGYLEDGLHPTAAGSFAYSDLILQTVIPEPSAASALLVSSLLMTRRRRRV